MAGCGGEDGSRIDFPPGPTDGAAESSIARPDAADAAEWVDRAVSVDDARDGATFPEADAPPDTAPPDARSEPTPTPTDAGQEREATAPGDVAADREATADAFTIDVAKPEPSSETGTKDASDASADAVPDAPEAAPPEDVPVGDHEDPRDAGCPTVGTVFDCGGVCGGMAWGYCARTCEFGAIGAVGYAAYDSTLRDLTISWPRAETTVCTNPCAPAPAPWSFGLDINVPLNNGQLDVPFCVRATSSGERRFSAVYGHPQPTADSGPVRAAYCDEGAPPTCLIAFGQPTNTADEQLRIIATATSKAPFGWTRYETAPLVDGGCPLSCP